MLCNSLRLDKFCSTFARLTIALYEELCVTQTRNAFFALLILLSKKQKLLVHFH